jgi:hypothetical protein
MALYKHATQDGYLKKKDLQDLAQPYADVSFAQTDIVNAQYYNAWSAMSTLINKELVDKNGNPAKYQLTDSGKNLARRLDQAECQLRSSSSISSPTFDFHCGTKSPEKPAPTVKAAPKGVVKVPTVRKTIHHTNETTATLRNIELPSTSSGLLQPNDIIFLDDDEFDRYPQHNLLLNSNGPTAPVKPIIEPSLPEKEVAVEELEPLPYIHVRDRITLKAGEYDIILCVDIAEVSGYITLLSHFKIYVQLVIKILTIADVVVLEITKKNLQPNRFRIVEFLTMYVNFRLEIICGSANRRLIRELVLIVN